MAIRSTRSSINFWMRTQVERSRVSGGLVTVYQTVSVSVEMAELIGCAEKLARGDVAIVVPVHRNEPRRQSRPVTANADAIVRGGGRDKDPVTILEGSASDIELRSPR